MSGPAVNYVCHSCRHALRSHRLIASQQKTNRAFSTSPTHAKTLATFTPTSSPELDALLTSWRNEVFLPSILSPHHQRLIYKESRHDILTTPPGVTVTVRTAPPPLSKNASKAIEEDFKLAPMNAWDKPNKRKSLQQICTYLSTLKDAGAWDNIIPFLEGLRTARYQVTDEFLENLTRKAGEVGQWNTILRAANMVKRTGLSLSRRQITKAILLDLHKRAVASSYKSGEPSKTLGKIVLMLEDKEHCGRLSQKDLEQGCRDMRRDPLVVASMLEQACGTSLVHHEGKDDEGKVADALAKFMALANTIPGGVIGYVETENLEKAPTFVLEELAVVSNALTLADKVDLSQSIGKQANFKVKMDLKELLKKINARIAVLRPEVETEADGNPRRSLEILEGIAKVQTSLQ